jgi:leucine-rich repeat protein SHOC2
MPAKSHVRLPVVLSLFLSAVLSASGQDRIPVEERQALIAFYDSTGGPDWLKQTNWLGPEGTEGTWEGIVVENGHVVSISLPGNGLKGTVPQEIGDLPYLQTLVLTGLIPPSSWGVPYGVRNQISAIAPELGLLPTLRVLSLDGLGLQSVPAELGNLAALQDLNLRDNQLTAVPASLGRLTLLQWLDLSGNLLASLPLDIFGLSNLTRLDLSRNEITSLPPQIGGLTKLTDLGIYDNKLTGLPSQIGKLTGLSELNLAGNPLVDIPAELGQLPDLVSLFFGGTSYLPAGLGALKNVQELSVFQSLRKLPDEVGQMVNLRLLRIRYTPLASLPATLDQLHNLELLDLSHNAFRSIPPIIGRIPSLQSLSLAENPLTGEIPASLGSLTSLKELVLMQGEGMNSVLSGPLPPELGNMSSLEKLILQGDFTGPIPREFGKLSKLTVLNLYGQFSEIPAELGALQNLVDLDIRGAYPRIPAPKAPFTSIPPEIGGIASLQKLRLLGSITEIPPELGNLTGLAVLWVTAEAQTAIPAALGNLHSLVELRLNGGFGGMIPAELAGLGNLRVLDLGGNLLTGSIPVWIGDLSELQGLNLESNRLDGPIPKELGNLKRLNTLYLSRNQLSGAIPPELAGLTSAWSINLSHNRLEGNIPYQILTRPSYLVFDASSNRLAGPLPKELGDLTKSWVRVDFRWNALYPVEVPVFEFIGGHHNGDFGGTQSYSPVDLSAAGTGNTVRLSWSPISYQADSGGYEVLYRQSADEPWTVYGMTNSKTATDFTVTGLETGRDYYFALRTVTYPHADNSNTVVGEPGNVAWAGTTMASETWFPLYPAGPTQYTGLAVSNVSGGEMHGSVQAITGIGGQAGFPANPAPLVLPTGQQKAAVNSEIFGLPVPAGPWSIKINADQSPVSLCLQGGPGMLDGLAGLAESHMTLFFPRIYEGADVLGEQAAVTRVNLLNPGAEPVVVQLRLIGPQTASNQATTVRTIPPGGLVSETLTELFGVAQPVSKAYLEGRALEGKGFAGVAVVTVAEGRSLFAVAGSPPSGFSRLRAAQVAAGPGVATSVRLINTDPVKRVVTLQLRLDTQASQPAVTFEIPAGGLIEGDLAALFGLSDALIAASLEVTADGTGVMGDILVYGPDLWYASAAPLSSRTFRDAVCGYIANGLGVFTGLAIFNPADKPADVTVEILSSEGTSRGKASVTLPARGRLARQTTELIPSSAGQIGGYIRVTATEPVVVQEMFAADSLDYMSTVPPVILR